MDLHHNCTIVYKQYKTYTLRVIYLINLFFCEFLCPERQNYLKNLRFLFFLRSEKNTLELNILAKYWRFPGISYHQSAAVIRQCRRLFIGVTAVTRVLTPREV